MGRLTQPELPPGALADLMRELHALHARAGRPSMRNLAREQSFSYTAVHDLFTKTTAEPPSLPVLLSVVDRLATLTPRDNVEETLDRFDALWRAAEQSEAVVAPQVEVAPDEESTTNFAATVRGPVELTVPRLIQSRVFQRRAALARLDQAFAQDGPASVAITGLGGVGKTTLVESWIQRLVERGGVEKILPLDLQGFGRFADLQSVPPEKVLEIFLARLGRRTADMPISLSDRAQLFRDTVEAIPGRHIVFLDNAGNADHVEPLVPGPSNAVVVVASRDPFDRFRMAKWLDTFDFIHLGLLDATESLELLAQMTGAEVIEREPTEAHRVAGYCAGLPLALGIAGTRISRAAEASAEPVAEIARQLASGGALDVLHEKDPKINLRVIFGSSGDRLDEPVREMFYRLGLRLATGIDAHAVALLGETTIGAAYRAIQDFDSVGLIESDGARFHIHDLLHDFAAERVMGEGDAPTATPKRVIEHALQTYCACVNYEFDRVNPNNVMVDRAALDDWLGDEDRRVVGDYRPGDWVRAERENLVSFVKAGCADYPPFAAAPRLAYALFYSLESTGYWTDWKAITKIGLQAAVTLGDILSQARLLRNLGRTELVRARDWINELRDDVDPADQQAATEYCTTAIDYFEQSNRTYERYNAEPGETTHHKPVRGEAVTVRREMADIYLLRAKLGAADAWLPRAIEHYRAVWETYQQLYLDAPERSANPLASLSVSLADALILSGELAKAQTALSTAFVYTRGEAYAPTKAPQNVRHRRNDCYALMRQADLYRCAGEHENCAKAYADAAEQLAEEGVPVDQARALALRGNLLAQTGHPEEARDDLVKALRVIPENREAERRVLETWINRLPGA